MDILPVSTRSSRSRFEAAEVEIGRLGRVLPAANVVGSPKELRPVLVSPPARPPRPEVSPVAEVVGKWLAVRVAASVEARPVPPPPKIEQKYR